MYETEGTNGDWSALRSVQKQVDIDLDGTEFEGNPDDLALTYGYETTDEAEDIEAFGGEAHG